MKTRQLRRHWQSTRREIIHDHGLPHGLVKHRPSPTTSLQGFDVDDTVEYYASAFLPLAGRQAGGL